MKACEPGSDIHMPYPYAYPPRFVLQVSSRYAVCNSTLELKFTGATSELVTEIQLHPVRSEYFLSGDNKLLIVMILISLKLKEIWKKSVENVNRE